MKIAYLGIDILYPVLRSVLREGCEIVKIFTCPTDNVTEFNTAVLGTARSHNIPYTCEKITSDDIERLQSDGCDLLLCAGYYYRAPISDTMPMVNFHPSPLPLGRGAWPMPIILLKGLTYGGITAHKMDRDFDTGDILLRETFPIRKGETLKSYMEQVYGRIPEMVHRLVTELPALLSQAYPQGEGEYWPCPSESDWTVTPDMDAEKADRVLRAFYGYECIYRSGDTSTELIGGMVVFGDNTGRPFPVSGGYILAERTRKL